MLCICAGYVRFYVNAKTENQTEQQQQQKHTQNHFAHIQDAIYLFCFASNQKLDKTINGTQFHLC